MRCSNGTIIQKLKNFLQIDMKDSNFEKKINPSPSEELDENLAKKIAPIFQEIYKYCGKEYPGIKALWKGFKYL